MNFFNEIEEAFYHLFEDYRFSHVVVREDVHTLENRDCIIRLTYDGGTISCDLLDPKSKDKKGYPLYSVMHFLHPAVKFEHLAFNTRDQLKECAEILTTYFSHVLSGDFSWTKDYLEFQGVLDRMIGYLTNNMDANHPIYQKFKRGDMSWIEDLQAYLTQK